MPFTNLVDRFIVHVEADTQGTTNEALVHFDFDVSSVLTPGQQAAACIAYMSGVGEVAINTAITEIDLLAAGAAGAVPVPFPVVDYAALVTANAPLIPMTAYGVTYGAGTMATLGSGVTVSMYTNTPGRSGTGRHYRPWLSADSLDSGGELAAAYVAGVTDAFNAFFLATAAGPWVPVGSPSKLAVFSPKTNLAHLVTVPRVSQEASRLRSRTK